MIGIGRHLKQTTKLTIDISSHIYTNAKVKWQNFSIGNSDSGFSYSLDQEQAFNCDFIHLVADIYAYKGLA